MSKTSRRKILLGAGALGVTGTVLAFRRKLGNLVGKYTQHASFTATPSLVPHDPNRDRTRIHVARGDTPAANVDAVLARLGAQGIGEIVGTDDVVIIKVSAQWWNQGMTNAAAVKRVIEHVLERPGFKGEIIVFENTHFRLANGSGLSRAWTHPSARNIDVPGWTKLDDLVTHFAAKKAPVSFVGLVDAGKSSLSDDPWHDPTHEHGTYGGDDRGPIPKGDPRDGYHWDFDRAFRLVKSWTEEARTPLSWPRFTSERSGLVVDLKDGVMRREGARLVSADRKLVWINMTTANEHGSTGFTGACKSTMGVVDMSAGRLGTHPLAAGYASVHYFGHGAPSATWRMAGPLAHFAKHVRSPDLILTVAEWVAFHPAGFEGPEDIRHSAATCTQKKTIVAGVDPVAIDAWAVRNLFVDVPSGNKKELLDLDDPSSMFTKFLRYYREVRGSGTIDASLVDIA